MKKFNLYDVMVTLSIENADGITTPSGWSTHRENGGGVNPFSFKPGVKLIEGWTRGVVQMREGELAEIHISHSLGLILDFGICVIYFSLIAVFCRFRAVSGLACKYWDGLRQLRSAKKPRMNLLKLSTLLLIISLPLSGTLEHLKAFVLGQAATPPPQNFRHKDWIRPKF